MGTDLNTVPPSQNRIIPLTKRQERAARMVAEGYLTQREIAEKVGVARRTVAAWIGEPEYGPFQKRLAEYRQRFAAVVMASGLARREKRVQHLTDLHQRLRRVIKERAKDPTMQNVPGGKTGVLVRTIKALEVTEDGTDARGRRIKRSVKKLVPEYETDTATTAELRRIQEQIAVEVGDREPEQEVGGQALAAIAISIKYEQPHAPEVPTEKFIDIPRIEIKHDGHEPADNGQ